MPATCSTKRNGRPTDRHPCPIYSMIAASPYPGPKVAGSVNPDAQVTVTPNLDAQVLGGRYDCSGSRWPERSARRRFGRHRCLGRRVWHWQGLFKMHARGFNILEIFETGRKKWLMSTMFRACSLLMCDVFTDFCHLWCLLMK
ncbi:uncharacterized protein [Aegilops tauschii subsp. strangulata]|uniref:uncharacterized protein n=1 Tax=Aegilops tauschii subsp. strangulata TaxID=200361 RepID=UPI00098AE8AC|nr:uncharacterized protein LOC109762980 [Aegilops tauschii subsp. strangulata]XP_044374145.1 uncharacterized protein LOC123096466 [Triticum aestivum]